MVSVPLLQEYPINPYVQYCHSLGVYHHQNPWPCSAAGEVTLLGFVDEDLVQEDKNLETKNPSNNTFIASFFIHADRTQYQCQCQCLREGEGREGCAAACETGMLFNCKHLQRGLMISSDFQLYKKRS